MNSPLGSADFFALEAGECLDHLEQLVNRPDGPPADELLRYARALRGSALMAGHPAIARAAGGLELVARGLRDGSIAWDAAARERTGQAIDEFRALVRAAPDWSSADAGRAARLTGDLESLAGGTAGAPVPAGDAPREPAELNTGVRAFVARESALIASALDRAAHSLREAPDAREPLYAVLRRMQSLRGLAELSELTPLPEVLDGIELGVGDLTRLFAPPPGVDRLLESAAHALTRIARDVAGSGRPDADPPEARQFTELLLRAFAVERDVVPIESLYVDGDDNPLRRSESQPQFSAPAPLGAVELVSYGEHLSQAADRIAEAQSGTIRDLRLYALVGTLRSVSPGGDAVATALAVFARSAREAIATGAAAGSATDFCGALRTAGGLLRNLADPGDQNLIGRRLLDLGHQLDLLEQAPATGQATAEPAAQDDSDVVPIRSLEYSEPEQPVVAIESLAPDVTPAAGAPGISSDRLASAYVTHARLLREQARAGTSASPLASPPEPTPADAEPPEVDIRTLCYRGRAALERADWVRQSLSSRFAPGSDLRAAEPLIRELIDLVPLALEAAD
jgi:hypothetical protein